MPDISLSFPWHRIAVFALAAGAVCHAAPTALLSPDAIAGERLYRDGILADGRVLTGIRTDGVQTMGAKAACINCHRASGMGGTEGNVLIPSVIGSILVAPGGRLTQRIPRMASSLSRVASYSSTRPAYTLDSFAQAVVSGKRASGEKMDYVMPHYRLDEQSIQQLWAYLATLKVGEAPGVDEKTLHLATIVTDDAPIAERDASLAIISRCINERSPRSSKAVNPPRAWQHHVWRLSANSDHWQQELARHLKLQPVFAIVSGVSGGTWTPIHDFCERGAIPCIFPNTVAVDARRESHWSFYFSQGVSLEAKVLAQHLVENTPAGGWKRIVQHVGASEPARLGAALLEQRLRDLGINVQMEQRPHYPFMETPLNEVLGAEDVLVLWLSPDELRKFSAQTMPPANSKIVFSGELGGLDDAPLAATWRHRALMLYPYEPAERRSRRVVLNTNNWMSDQGIVLTPSLLRLQGNTYSACEMLTRALQIMGTQYSREYFLELIETADEGALATAFPRFTLGPNQRYGSSGAYIMQYSSLGLGHWVPVGDWIVPR